MTDITEKTVDIDDILKSKMGDKAKFVPSLLKKWLKRIVHQDEVNKYLWESRHLTGTEWLEECVRYLDMTLEVEGMENLPDKDDGKLYTFVSNHPLGGADGVALGSIIGRHYDGNFRVPASWRLSYLTEDNRWVDVEALSPYTVRKDCYNSVDFKTVTTKGLKITATLQDKQSGGILEWKVNRTE